MVRAMVHSTKHFIQTTLTSVLTGAKLDTVIVDSVSTPDKNINSEVEEGATVKAVYMEMWTIGSVSDQFFTAIVYKLPAGASSATTVQIADLTSWVNKKNILYTTQGLTGNDGISIPLPLYKGWIKIPKGKQRWGLGDRLVFTIMSRGDATIKLCGFYLYKEYT